MSAGLVARYPHLVRDCVGLGHEIVAHGLDMGHVHAGDLAEAVERGWVATALATLRAASGQAVKGWYSPAHAETWTTLDLVAQAGCSYVCDWANDDMPYPLRTASGGLHAMPHGFEVSDLQLFHAYRHTAAQYVRQVTDHFDHHYREAAEHGGRIVTLSLRPWVSGVPHRIAAVEAVLDHILSLAGVWNATGAEILEAWTAQQA
jgi:allantoinase